MPQISKYPISKDVADRIFEIFLKILVQVRSNKDADDFAYDLFTPTERVMFAKRLAIAFLLLKGYQYRIISRLLKVSLATISSVNFSLKHGRGSYKKVLENLMKEENLEKFFGNILEKILSMPAASIKGGTLWRYLRDEVRKENEKKKGII